MIRPAPRGGAQAPLLPSRERDPVAVSAGVVIVRFGTPIPVGAGCHYCHRAATTRDHIVAKTRGGSNSWWNLAPSCGKCNGRKGSGGSGCACAFCERARWLYDLGHRRF